MKHSALSISARSSNEISTRITRPLPASVEQGQETTGVATLEVSTQDPQPGPPSNGTTSVGAENTDVSPALADLANTDPPVEDEHPFNGNTPAMEADSQVSELPTSTLAEVGQPAASQFPQLPSLLQFVQLGEGAALLLRGLWLVSSAWCLLLPGLVPLSYFCIPSLRAMPILQASHRVFPRTIAQLQGQVLLYVQVRLRAVASLPAA